MGYERFQKHLPHSTCQSPLKQSIARIFQIKETHFFVHKIAVLIAREAQIKAMPSQFVFHESRVDIQYLLHNTCTVCL